MAVSLPTAADVRRAREQAAKSAAEGAEAARVPLLAALGAGEYAITAVTNAVAGARSRAAGARTAATEGAEEAQHRFAALPQRLSAEDLRKLVDDLRVHAETAYAEFAERGEQAWSRLREQPQVRDAIARVELYTEKLDSRVDTLVDDAHDAAEKALGRVTRQTRSAGERVARTTQRFATVTAVTVSDVSEGAAEAVSEAGADAAESIGRVGDQVAEDARSATRRAASRTTPRTVSTRRATPKPAARRAPVADPHGSEAGS